MSHLSCCLVSHTLESGIGPADANVLLARELLSRGHAVSLCALNDPRRMDVLTESRLVGDSSVNTLHIPESLTWEQKAKHLRTFLEEAKPGFILFRFIPYSLNPKGIVWNAAKFLPQVFRDTPTIWLVDEIWLGSDSGKLRHRLVGLLQKRSILRLLKRSNPHRVFTNNEYNAKTLRKCGVPAASLRLFGNIPVVAPDNFQWMAHELANAQIPVTLANRNELLLLGIFGVFHADWNPDLFMAALQKKAEQHGKKVCFVGIGSLRSYDDHWRNTSNAWGVSFRFVHLGCRDEREVSLFLQSVDFGLTTNPYYLVGKSGTCMAMLDHGLPILVPRLTSHDDMTEFPADLVIRCGNNPPDEIFKERARIAASPQLPRAVDELVSVMDRGAAKAE